MASEELALAYLRRKELFYMDMLEPLRRGSAQLLYAADDGVLLYDRLGEVHMLTARDHAALEKMLERMPVCDILVGHELWCKDELAARFGLKTEQICRQAGWTASQPPQAVPFDGSLQLLTPEWAPYVYQHYSHAFGGVAYMEGAIRRGMLGAFVGQTLAGFVGFHSEGTIGMLEVLPAYRRRGLGEVLLRGAVRLALERGQYAFGQVFIDNAPSLALQQKVGMSVSDEILYWLF